MTEVLARMAGALQTNIDILLEPADEILRRALVKREERIQKWEAQHRARELKNARALSTTEFHLGNYARVIELLTPFEDLLSKADQLRLALSVQRNKKAGRKRP